MTAASEKSAVLWELHYSALSHARDNCGRCRQFCWAWTAEEVYRIQLPGMPGAFAEAPKIAEDLMDFIALDYSVADFGMNLMIRAAQFFRRKFQRLEAA